MSKYEDEQMGAAVWADAPEPIVPPMRTFRVTLDDGCDDIYIDAHSVTCDGDAAHFYRYQAAATTEGPKRAAYNVRTLRPYLDVEDVTAHLAATGKLLN